MPFLFRENYRGYNERSIAAWRNSGLITPRPNIVKDIRG